MQVTLKQIMAVTLCAGLLAGCGAGGTLTPSAVTSGPDEFGLVPNKALQQPDSYAELPTPTPNGTNIATLDPKADAIRLLGGTLPQTGIDGSVVSYASRYGVDPEIRASLADADARFQKRRQAVSLGIGKYQYEKAYKRFALDASAEWRRLLGLGVLVPSAPPER